MVWSGRLEDLGLRSVNFYCGSYRVVSRIVFRLHCAQLCGVWRRLEVCVVKSVWLCVGCWCMEWT